MNQVRYWTSQAEMKEKLNQEYDTKINEQERIIDALNKQRRLREESEGEFQDCLSAVNLNEYVFVTSYQSLLLPLYLRATEGGAVEFGAAEPGASESEL